MEWKASPAYSVTVREKSIRTHNWRKVHSDNSSQELWAMNKKATK